MQQMLIFAFSADKELAGYVESMDEITSAEATVFAIDFDDFDDSSCDGSKIEYYINGKIFQSFPNGKLLIFFKSMHISISHQMQAV